MSGTNKNGKDVCEYLKETYAEDSNIHLNLEPPYAEVDDISSTDPQSKLDYKFNTLHINIQSLPSKFEKLASFIRELKQKDIRIDTIIQCETFLNDSKSHHFHLPGYNVVFKNKQTKSRGGVALYLPDTI